MLTTNLFGEEVSAEAQKKIHGYCNLWKKKNHYRVAENKDTCCKTCWFHISKEFHNKHYHKCQNLGNSESEATDIRLKNVCGLYKLKK